MKIGLKTMLLDVYKCFFSMIACFTAVAKYNLARKNLESSENFEEVATLYTKAPARNQIILDIL